MEEAVPESAFPRNPRFECVRGCVACCTGGPGYVWLSEADANALAAHFSLSRAEFLERYCRNVDTGLGLSPSLEERNDYSCIFLGDSGCTVYPVRPVQCRTYPFWESILSSPESWAEETRHCPGMGHGPAVSEETIIDAVLERRQNPPILLPYRGEAT
ncbi:MAG: YkgJ family cysteine cluster protein [Rectinema sp.]